jgi:purine-cytosine permease-like protein
VGIAAATATNMSDPAAGIVRLIPSWLSIAYLAVIVGGTVTNNFLNTYSSGLCLQAIGVRIRRSRSVVFDAVVGGTMAGYALFVHDFTNTFQQFLSLMIIWIAPWCGIYLTDMLLRRARYHGPALLARGGPYWYVRGWNPRALIAFLLGICAAMLFANGSLYHGPLIKWIGDGDISIFAGFLVAGASYFALMRPLIVAKTRREEGVARVDPSSLAEIPVGIVPEGLTIGERTPEEA